MVGCTDPDKVNKYKEVPLSRRTNTDRQHELACNVTEQLKNVIEKENIYYSVALDESTDSTDSAQVLYFIRAIIDDFQLYEELLALGTLKGRTRGIDISNNFKEQCHKIGLYFTNLQNLCAKSVTLNDTLLNVISIIDYIRGNASKHRQFRRMLMMDDELTKVMSETEDIYGHFKEYESVLDTLIEEYNKRFNDFEEHGITLKLAFQPHFVDVSEAPEELQMELIELSDKRENPVEIWKNAIEYLHLREHARRLISCFSSTSVLL
ncbi:protein FAM200C-like [Palaemon carinicauda]|uniref:protein FAM200C-like n=1 Tax=Palaemon carinicauda TaxID=392227 RepID=UPI0035B579CA